MPGGNQNMPCRENLGMESLFSGMVGGHGGKREKRRDREKERKEEGGRDRMLPL